MCYDVFFGLCMLLNISIILFNFKVIYLNNTRVWDAVVTPFTNYSVSVSCIPLVDNKPQGFWSEPVVQNFTSKKDGKWILSKFEIQKMKEVKLFFSSKKVVSGFIASSSKSE